MRNHSTPAPCLTGFMKVFYTPPSGVNIDEMKLLLQRINWLIGE